MAELIDSVAADAAEITTFLALPDARFFAYEYQTYDPAHAVFIQARNEGELIGTQALMPYPLVIGGQRLMTGRSERTRVASTVRGGGFFPALMEACADAGAAKGLQFIWGSTKLKKAFQRVGFLYFENFYEHALLCLSTPAAFTDVKAPQSGRLRAAKLAATAPSAALRMTARLRPAEHLEMTSAPRNASDVAQLYERLRGKERLIVLDHEERLLHWLLDEGGRNVLRYYGYRGDSLAAYAYVDVSTGSTAQLLDFGAVDARALHALLRGMLPEIRRHGVAFLEAAYNAWNPWLRRLRRSLIASGFVPVYRGGGFVVRPLHFKDYNYLNDLSTWYITALWVQLYPGT